MSRLNILRSLLAAGVVACAANAQAVVCPNSQDVDVTLPTNARWEMCWALAPEEGVVLSDGYFTDADGGRRKVFKRLSVAQINVVFDDATAPLNLVTGAGLGGSNLHSLSTQECPGGTLLTGALCQRTESRGYAYKSYAQQKQGYNLVLSSSSTPGASTYIVRWAFGDDGSVAPSIGLSGELPRVSSGAGSNGWPIDAAGSIGVGFTNNYFWRMDFDLGTDAANDAVEELEIVPSSDRRRKTKILTSLASESARPINVDRKRSWRILDTQLTNADGRAISYHLEPLHTAHRYRGSSAALASDAQFTRYNACERFATNNVAANCGSSITDYVNGQSIAAADVVLWYSLSYHHLPRAEDSPAIGVHWDGFIVVPRDWTALNPLAQLELPRERLLALVWPTAAPLVEQES